MRIGRFLETNRPERYHKVSQEDSDEGICCSVNYCTSKDSMHDPVVSTYNSAGYDVDFEGTFFATNSFVRDMAWASAKLNNAP